MTAGACSRSSSVSNSGTTSRCDSGDAAARLTSPASRARNNTRTRSSGSDVTETMYVIADVHQITMQSVRANHFDHRVNSCAASVLRTGAHQTFAHQHEISLELCGIVIRRWIVDTFACVSRRGEASCRLYARQHESEF